LAKGQSVAARKRWIGFTAQPRGRLLVDAGARKALEQDGRSLLAIGVVKVVGRFHKGDVVALCDKEDVEFARGLTNYDAEDVQRIRGLKSHEIAESLGHCPYEEIMHRNNIVVLS
jgi:glutamate 5-kinase